MHDEINSEQRESRRGYIPAACVRYIEKLQSYSEKANADNNKTDPHAGGMYRATWVIAGAAILSFAAAIIQASIFNGQLSAMRSSDEKIGEQVRAMGRQLDLLEVDQRPWVKADIEIASDLTFGSSSAANLTIRYKVKNVGRSPAFNLNAWPKLIQFTGHFGIENLLKKRCDEMSVSLQDMKMVSWGNILFPGDTDQIEAEISLSLPNEEGPVPKKPVGSEIPNSSLYNPNIVTNPNILTNPSIVPGTSPYIINPSTAITLNSLNPLVSAFPTLSTHIVLLSCVFYESRVGARKPHQTAESLYLSQDVPGYPAGEGLHLSSREMIPKSGLKLVRPPFEWRKYAN